MRGISRRTFLQSASASAALAAVWSDAALLMANPLGLPLGLQLYSVREMLPTDYEGTLRKLGAMGYREVEAAGFFGRNPHEVKRAMDGAELRCVSATIRWRSYCRRSRKPFSTPRIWGSSTLSVRRRCRCRKIHRRQALASLVRKSRR